MIERSRSLYLKQIAQIVKKINKYFKVYSIYNKKKLLYSIYSSYFQKHIFFEKYFMSTIYIKVIGVVFEKQTCKLCSQTFLNE